MAAGTATVMVCTVGGVTLYSGGSVITHVDSLVTVTNGLTCSVVIDDLSRMIVYARGALSTGTVTLKITAGGNFIGGNVAQKTYALVSEAAMIISGLESSIHKGAAYLSIVPTGGSAIIGVFKIPRSAS
jgi:hypothetical protein